LRPDAVGADDDCGAVVDVVERVDGLDTEGLEIPDHALVVHDLAERMGRLALGTGLLGLVDGLAHAVAEARPLGDPDLGNRARAFAHVELSIPRGSRSTRWTSRSLRFEAFGVRGIHAALARREQRRDASHDLARRGSRGPAAVSLLARL